MRKINSSFFVVIFSFNAYSIWGDTMEKKLPKVFANNLNDVHNNENTFYFSSDKASNDQEMTRSLKGNSVNEKIKEIFNSTNYIYKADVEIEFDNETVSKRIIGKNNNNLITMDNEVIPIEKIKDIRYK